MNLLEEFALEAKMWWGLWWLKPSVGVLWPPAWEQCIAVAQGALKKTWTPAIMECPKFCPDCVTLLSLGQTFPRLCVLRIPLAAGGEAQLIFI